MKRYKHLRTNKVAVLDEGKNIYCIVDNSSETIPVCFVENSNDWKLIPDIVNDKYSLNSILARNPKRFDETPDFEILKFKDTHNEYFKKDNGMFTINLQYEYTAEELLKKARITSIKRTKDNVVFSIGDRTNFGIIIGFAIDDKLHKPVRIKVGFSKIGEKTMSIVQYLSTVVKLKPIFTTEDGVDIYQGDECWYALPRSSFEGKFTLKRRQCNGRAVEGKYFFHKHNAEAYIFGTSEVVYFVNKINWAVVKSTDAKDFTSEVKYKTEEEANKYIDENKPKYSEKDIKKFYALYFSKVFADFLHDKLLEITKNENNSSK